MTKPPASGTDWLRQQRMKAAGAVTPTPPACNNEDAIDSQVERFLQLNGVKYAPKSMIPIAMFDEKASLANQARDVPIVPESVERFTASLRAGEYLPPVIVFPQGNKVVTVDGNNRYASHKRHGSQFVPGFVIDEATPSETIALLTVAANVGHGVTPDLNWRKRQAAHLVSVGFTSDRACSAAGVTKAQLGDFQALTRADARARSLKIQTGWLELPQASRINLGRIALDSVFFQAARCAIDTAMQTEDTRILLKDIKSLGSESEQVAMIAKVSEERKLEAKTKAATGATGRVSSPKQSLFTSLGKIMKIDPAELARQVLTDLDRAELTRRLDKAGEKLIELQIAMNDAKVQARDAG